MRQSLALVVLALVAVSGCTAPVGSAAESQNGPAGTSTATPTPTATTTSTDTPTPTATPNRPSGTETSTAGDPPTDARNASTVEYADLSPTQQAAFDAALTGEVRFVPNSSYVDGEFHFDDGDPFRGHDFVTKNGTQYEIELTSGELYASYGIDATAGRPDADENATIVALANLSTDVRDEVRWAVENGSYGVPMGKWQSLPEELQETRYVRYETEIYRLGYVVGDSWAEVLTVERADGQTEDRND